MGKVLSVLAAVLRSRTSKVTVGVAVALLVWYFRFNRKRSLYRWAVAKAYSLTPYLYAKVDVLLDQYAAASDGVRLCSDIYLPVEASSASGASDRLFDVVLMRTPYNRKFLRFASNRFAERGYIVVAQDTRGRFGSDGKLAMMEHEDTDGLATVRWIAKQPWFRPGAKVNIFGVSYLGFAAWAANAAVAAAHDAAGGHDASIPEVASLMPVMTSSCMHNVCYPDGCTSIELLCRWAFLTHMLGGPGLGEPRPRSLSLRHTLYLLLFLSGDEDKAMQRARLHMGLRTVQRRVLQQQHIELPIELNKNTRFWDVRNHYEAIPRARAVHSVAGWYDLMCRETIEDYEKFVSGNEGGSGSGSGAGAGSTHGSVTADVDTDDDDNGQPTAWLTVGPWHHFESMAMGPFGTIVQEACNWMDLTNDHSSGFPPRKPVKLFFMEGHPSQGAWREFDHWPPVSSSWNYYLHGDGSLSKTAVGTSDAPPSTYRYDPTDPTPHVKGPRFHRTDAGAGDQRPLERRPDVLVFTSEPLTHTLEVAGRVTLRVHIRIAGGTSVDVVGRLCDVHPNGTSINLCEGQRRIAIEASETSDVHEVTVDMWHTANVFKPGHRVRLHVASGAYPRLLHNYGLGDGYADMDCTGAPPPEATAVRVQVFHDQLLDSHLVLPVLGASLPSRGSQSHLAQRSNSSRAIAGLLATAHRASLSSFSQN